MVAESRNLGHANSAVTVDPVDTSSLHSSDTPDRRLRSQPGARVPARPQHGVAPEGVQHFSGPRSPPDTPGMVKQACHRLCEKLTGEFTQPMVQLYDHPEPPIHQPTLGAAKCVAGHQHVAYDAKVQQGATLAC